MKNSIHIIAIIFSLWIGNNLFGQNNGVTIGGSETRSDAVLWLIPSGNDGKQGLVLPAAERADFTPTIEGMVIFDPSDQTIYLWDGTNWQALGAGGSGSADDWGTQTVVSDDIFSGDGTIVDPLTLASQDAGLGQVLKWNGTSWAPALDETGETGASVNSINEVTGDGTVGNPLQLAQQGAVVGQILKWDGTAWTPADDLNGGTGATYTAGSGIQIDGDNNIINTGDADADPSNELQTLSFDVATNELSLTNGNSISIPTGGTDADADPTNEIQTLSFDAATNELSLSDGNSVTIPTGGSDADADPTNEIQDLSLTGTTLNITGGSGVNLAALIPPGGTDDQNLVLTGDNLTIEGGSGTVDLSNYVDDADADPSNEIQTLSFNNVTNQLSLSDGNSVTIPTGGTDADADPTNEIQTISYDAITGEVELTDGGSFILTSSGSGAFESESGVVKPTDVNDDDFVFGSEQLDDDPGTSDDNRRMFFDKSNGAFRTGRASGDQWDSSNRGSNSVAMGTNTTATSHSSTALGFHTQATQLDATSMGYYTQASGQRSTSMGEYTIAQSASSVAMGRYNVGGGSSSSWNENDKLFEIGNGISSVDRSNALTVLKNGFVGIGESSPNGSLVIGNNFDDAFLNLPEITLGGVGESGGVINIGNEASRMEVFSTNVLDGAIFVYDDSDPDGKGDLRISARTVNIGQNANGTDYILNVTQEGNFGHNFAREDFNWEKYINDGTGTLGLYTDGSLSPVGSFNYTTGAYSSLSDRSTKEDVKSIGSVLGKVNDLEPLRYHFIGEKNNKKSLGFIAQDVLEIFPELVTFVEGREGAEGRHLMDYTGFGVIAIAAIQEQQEQIHYQEEIITEQQEEIDALKEALTKLMYRVDCLENK